MKILAWHVNYLKYKAVKPTPVADEGGNGSIEDGFVLFTCVEKGDESKQDILGQYVSLLDELHDRTGVSKFLIYPYAHLSHNLGSPKFAKTFLNSVVSVDKYEISKAPFGWYKSFECSVKGHPLAEAYREL